MTLSACLFYGSKLLRKCQKFTNRQVERKCSTFAHELLIAKLSISEVHKHMVVVQIAVNAKPFTFISLSSIILMNSYRNQLIYIIGANN